MNSKSWGIFMFPLLALIRSSLGNMEAEEERWMTDEGEEVVLSSCSSTLTNAGPSLWSIFDPNKSVKSEWLLSSSHC